MTRSIPHRELRNNSAAVLRAVQAGETFEITNHGEVVALLVPPNGTQPLSIRPATRRGGFSDLRGVRLDHPVQDDLDYLRGER
ncbi:type II toxin-antitoxin system prevent-host-death family antitoxin [Geodermatophilus sp. DF01-2]|uniref:type II toxin-antitoxin system Phd/YefM family antitoxin n=1 Tax=Geodermatophilus sp. DF01-2 TaxID=2559610 RepID=UPI001073DFBD|nr:type II toxin-antitoxin system prevent-host-death family antitoxin [Geodermatophilus sp. DF01_2]TFV54590.1 type II toxin-antitoxin system prevent-host-death family antitoxin [Geodermatophilus sp. DF01_2]